MTVSTRVQAVMVNRFALVCRRLSPLLKQRKQSTTKQRDCGKKFQTCNNSLLLISTYAITLDSGSSCCLVLTDLVRCELRQVALQQRPCPTCHRNQTSSIPRATRPTPGIILADLLYLLLATLQLLSDILHATGMHIHRDHHPGLEHRP